jgi:hypothetical protein
MTDGGTPLKKFLLVGCLFVLRHIQHAKFSASRFFGWRARQHVCAKFLLHAIVPLC